MTSTKPRTAPETRLRELDGWRAISVFLVIAGHVLFIRFFNFAAGHKHLLHEFNFTVLGVRIFFVISGFVICRLIILEEKHRGAFSMPAFYIRRVFRILPPFYLYLLFVFVLHKFGVIFVTGRGIASAGLFLYDFVPAQIGGWFVGHTWSLAVEEQFYLLFPTLWILTRKIGRARAFLGIFCLLALWNFWAAVAGWNDFTTPRIRSGFSCICCGVLIAILEERARAIARAVPAFVILMIALSLFWHPWEAITWESALFDSIYIPSAIALLLVFSLERKTRLRSFLCWKPVQAIGLTSYGIYLWQELFTGPEGAVKIAGSSIVFWLPLLFGIVPLSYFFLERPAMRLGRSLADRVRFAANLESTLR